MKNGLLNTSSSLASVSVNERLGPYYVIYYTVIDAKVSSARSTQTYDGRASTDWTYVLLF